MFDRRSFSLAPQAFRFVALSVVFKWLALLASIAFVTSLAAFAGALASSEAPDTARFSLAAALTIGAYFALQAVANRFGARAGSVARSHVTKAVFDKLCRLGPSYESGVDAHEAVQLLGEGAERLRPYFSTYMPQLFFAVLAPVTLFFATFGICWPAAVVMLACVPLMPASIVALMKRARKHLGESWGAYVDLGGSFLDAIAGLTTLKVYGADGRAQERLGDQAEGFRTTTMRLLRVQLNSVTFMDLFAYGGMACGIIVALLQMAAGTLQVGAAFSVVLLSGLFFTPMRAFGALFHVGMNANEVIARICDLLDAPEPARGDEELGCAPPTIECAGLALTRAGDTLLDGVDVRVEPLTFTGIVGQSGSGKSVLLRVIAGQEDGYEGSVKIGGIELSELSARSLREAVTLVSQASHVFKGTVRANLQLGKPSATDYELWEALRKVGLDDYVIAIGGLGAELREGGSNLSGGQRQRLCFARAILRDTPIYLFDEATSGIDAESEEALLQFIRELSLTKTVLCATHRLSSVTHADGVVVMRLGRVAERGIHYHLVRDGQSEYRRLWDASAQLEKFARLGEDVEMKTEDEMSEFEKVMATLPREAAQMMFAALATREALKYRREVEGGHGDPIAAGHPAWIPLPSDYRAHAHDTGQDERAARGGKTAVAADGPRAGFPGRSRISALRSLLGQTRSLRKGLGLAVLSGAASALAVVGLAAFAVLGALVAGGRPGFDAVPLAAPLAGLVVCALVRGPAHYAERLLTHDQTYRTVAALRDSVFAKMRELCPAKLESRDAGDLVSLLTSDIEVLEGFYSKTIAPVCAAASAAAVIVAAAAALSWQLALVLLAAFAVIGGAVPAVAARITAQRSHDLHAFSVDMSAFLLDSLRGFADLAQFGRADEYADEIAGHLDTLSDGDRDIARLTSPLAALAQTLSFAFQAVLALCACALAGAGSVSPVAAAAAVMLAGFAFEPAVAVAGVGFSFGRTAAAQRIADVLEEQPVTESRAGGDSVGEFTGASFEDVAFSYPASSERALDGVSLDVARGSLVRITGMSGAGKSTLLKLLMRFWDVDAGRVVVSGHDVRGIDTQSLRKSIAYMTQDTYLFAGSLRDNLLVASPDADDAALSAVLETVGLPMALDSAVGGNGGRGTLSDGERQRVGLARALLSGAELLLLDEPTSNLDSLNEAVVLRALASETLDKTVVVVSHRRPVAALADETYVVRARSR